MFELNLPSFSPQLTQKNGKPFIFDVVRRKYVSLTPEEWVRQHFIHFLIAQKYPKSLMQVERMHQQNALQKRSDILVFDRQMQPHLLVECKSPFLKINEGMLSQLLIYNQHFNAPLITLTNGLTHFYWEKGSEGYERVEELPIFGL
ncbi:MAG: type I restriction enzyme HsdR N-terminal domain-containing protein [Bacteroidota bacterium]